MSTLWMEKMTKTQKKKLPRKLSNEQGYRTIQIKPIHLGKLQLVLPGSSRPSESTLQATNSTFTFALSASVPSLDYLHWWMEILQSPRSLDLALESLQISYQTIHISERHGCQVFFSIWITTILWEYAYWTHSGTLKYLMMHNYCPTFYIRTWTRAMGISIMRGSIK